MVSIMIITNFLLIELLLLFRIHKSLESFYEDRREAIDSCRQNNSQCPIHSILTSIICDLSLPLLFPVKFSFSDNNPYLQHKDDWVCVLQQKCNKN